VIEELCGGHHLRYRVNHGILKIEPDTPYAYTYNLQFLVLTRTNQNRISVATDVFTTVETGNNKDEDNGSNTNLTAETKIDFWDELAENLSIILNDFRSSAAEGPYTEQAKFTFHKQAGMISIYATEAQHHEIRTYLDELRSNVERQVLIEAKIVEVTLNDQFQSGINWNALRGSFVLQMPLGEIAQPGHLNDSVPPPRNVFTIGGNAKKITGLVSVLNHFGTVRTLSNPRLTVLQNQSALLKVARNRVYFKLNYTRDYNYFEKREHTYYSSDVKTVPIGLMMYVHPTIRADGKIIMTLRPTISQITQEIADPAVSIASHQTLQSFIPEVQVRELDTVFAADSGETVVVGGLMEERTKNESDGIPNAEDIPLLGSLFKAKSNDRALTELVIFIRATIIENEEAVPTYEPSTVTPADKRAYQKFTQDPRPVKM
jgi:MSHA type pilus biogenesis protein MshL